MTKVGEGSGGPGDGAPAEMTADARVRANPASLASSLLSANEPTPPPSDSGVPIGEASTPIAQSHLLPPLPPPRPQPAPAALGNRPDEEDPRVGATFGKYRVVRRLGRGGMGTVYLGEDTILRRSVAIKFLPDNLVNNPEVVERFLREAQVAGRLNHPNIIAIHDVAKDKGGCYMVMELLDPHSARSRMNRGPYPWQVATRIIADCCAALTMAHAAGVIHRDIKPENVTLSR